MSAARVWRIVLLVASSVLSIGAGVMWLAVPIRDPYLTARAYQPYSSTAARGSLMLCCLSVLAFAVAIALTVVVSRQEQGEPTGRSVSPLALLIPLALLVGAVAVNWQIFTDTRA